MCLIPVKGVLNVGYNHSRLEIVHMFSYYCKQTISNLSKTVETNAIRVQSYRKGWLTCSNQ